MRKYLSYILLLSSAIALSACTTPQERLNRETRGISTMPPLFQEGYHAGCQSGLFAAGSTSFLYNKDLQKMRLPAYKQGWEDGFKICQSRQVELNRQWDTRSSITFSNSWGHSGHHRHHH